MSNGQQWEQRSVSAPSPRRYQPGYHYAVPRPRVFNQKRIEDLAQPKKPRTVWIRTLGRRVFWGDQESLWPLNKSTLAAQATPRLSELSEPKKNFQARPNAEFLYSCGRQSVIWGVTPGATGAEATPRLQQLSKPKALKTGFLEDRPHYVFSCGRSSPIWGVTEDAQRPATSDHILHLSLPKEVHSDYQQPRGVETIIPKPALTASASARIETLAEAKVRSEGPYRDPMWPVKHYWKDEAEPEDEVSENAMTSHPKKRLWDLAVPKQVPETYIPERNCIWQVSKSTMRAQPSKRVLELSTPQYTR